MRRFIARSSKVIPIILAFAMIFSSGLVAFADEDGGPIAVPISGNVADDAYIGEVGGGYINVTAVLADAETIIAAEEAVYKAATEMAAATGIVLSAVAPPMRVTVTEPNTVATVTLPDDIETTDITTMAILAEDGSLIPVPTRVNSNGEVVVLLSGDMVLIPLNVQANFVDTYLGASYMHVTEEINLAASMMIIQGYGNGVFSPRGQVSGQAAVTMFMRAIGVPVVWESAMETAQELGLISAGVVPGAPMTRIKTAQLIVNALDSIGMESNITLEEAVGFLKPYPDLATGLTDDETIAMAVCVGLGIFQGGSSGLMNPNATLQRSAMASLSVRLQNVFLDICEEE